MRAKLRQLKQDLRQGKHEPIAQTERWLQSVVRGYFNYYAVRGNLDSLAVFRQRLLALWWRRLRRRSQKHPFSWTSTRGRGSLVSATACAPSTSCRSLRSPVIRDKNRMRFYERPSGSVRGYHAQWYPSGISESPAGVLSESAYNSSGVRRFRDAPTPTWNIRVCVTTGLDAHR